MLSRTKRIKPLIPVSLSTLASLSEYRAMVLNIWPGCIRQWYPFIAFQSYEKQCPC
jgi:hypothetical protein